MRKKMLALGMSLVLTLGCFTGCGNSSGGGSDNTGNVGTSDTESEVSSTLKELRKKGTITIAGSGTAPFGFEDTNTGELRGVDLEISIAVAKKLGIKKVNYVVTTFDNLIAALQAGKCDVISSAMYITEERQKVINFSDIYYREGEGILFPEEEGYKSLEDMKGAVCAIEQGSGYADVAQQYVEDGIFKRLDTYPSIDETVLALKSSKANVAMADNVALAYISSQEGNKDADLTLLEPYEMKYAGDIGAGFMKDDPAFVEEWNEALKELKEDGTVMKIMKSYGLDETFYAEPGDDETVNP